MTKQNDMHQDERVQLYEIGYLVVPTVAEEQLPGVVEGIHKILKDTEAEITIEGAPVLRDLAYQIAQAAVGKKLKFDTAYFGYVVFKTTPDKAPVINKAMESMDKILRYILIKTDEETAMTPKIVPEALIEKTDEVAPATEVKATEEEMDKKIDTLVTN